MNRQPLHITGVGCLTPFGHAMEDIAIGLTEKKSAIQITPLPKGCRNQAAPIGTIPAFKELLSEFIQPNMRRKMSRLSRMSVIAGGLALQSAGLLNEDAAEIGVAVGTAFGSTGQSEIFFLDGMEHGHANPGLFPETVPNAPAGQISLRYTLKGPNFTVCQQNLSAEFALLLAMDMIKAGMAQRMLVVSSEEMSPPLLKGFDALGILKREDECSASGIELSPRTAPGEAAVAILLESAEAVQKRNAKPLATLIDVEMHGGGRWPAGFNLNPTDLQDVYENLSSRQSINAEIIVANATFIGTVDRSHIEHLSRLFDKPKKFLMPEYATGNIMGAGLLRTVTGILLLQKNNLPIRSFERDLPHNINLDSFHDEMSDSPSQVLISTMSAGGGGGMVLLGK